MESLLIALLLTVGIAWPLLARRRASANRSALPLAVLAIVSGAAGAWALTNHGRSGVTSEISMSRPISVPSEGYITAETCRACHPHHYDTWRGSYHSSMTQLASSDTIMAPFDDVELRLQGRLYRLFRDGDDFWVEMDDPAEDVPGAMAVSIDTPSKLPRTTRRIAMTTGSHNFQGYWFETGVGRKLLQLPFAYTIAERRWIPDHTSFLRPPWPEGAKLPVAGPGNWERGCIKCHATNGRPRLDTSGQGTIDTHVSEFGISCEACHGPAAEHVRINQNPARRYSRRWAADPDPTVVHPERLSHRASAEVCGRCHAFDPVIAVASASWRRKNGAAASSLATDDLAPTADGAAQSVAIEASPHGAVELESRYWPDGMPRVAGREYSSLVRSGCYQRGELSCLSCHVLHQPPDDPRPREVWADDQLKLGMRGNDACLQCHTSFSTKLAEHTNHNAESTGSLCYNCHMPYTTYGLHKAIRSHQIDSPSLGVTLETGRPNACNQCHLDKTAGWAANYLSEWYDQPIPELTQDEQDVSAFVLFALKGDAAQRALAAWSMGWDTAHRASGDRWEAPFLMSFLYDPYDAVRFIAIRSLRTLPGFEEFTYDFVASESERGHVGARIGAVWAKQQQSLSRRTGRELLIKPDGTLRMDEVLRISQQRDDRPVEIRE